MSLRLPISLILFSTAPPPTQIYTLSLHDALPISQGSPGRRARSAALAGLPTQPSGGDPRLAQRADRGGGAADRKSTRLNSSHRTISYAVFCLKKKKKKKKQQITYKQSSNLNKQNY